MKVIVLVLRGLHLGYVGCYGNGWIDTPGFDRLAAEGIVFDQHFADCPEGAAARRAWWTGFWPSPALQSEIPMPDLLECLHRNGVRAGLVLDASHLLSAAFDDRWDVVRSVAQLDEMESPLNRILASARLDTDELTEGDNWMLWIDSGILLPPWNVPAEHLDAYFPPPVSDDEAEPGEAEVDSLEPLLDPVPGLLPEPADSSFLRLQSTYAGVVTYADKIVDGLLDELHDRGLSEGTMLIVMADHGQALGEHGIVGAHRPWLHDELIHVPLIMRLPGAAAAGRRIAALTQSVDVFPTLLDCLGIAAPPSHGYSLLPVARGELEAVRSHVCCGLRLGDCEEWAMRTTDWAFLLPVVGPAEDALRTSQLYVKPDDRWEVNNVIQHHLELADRSEQTLRAFVAAPRRIGLETPWTAESGGTAP
jgi:arylsulfatase A-like enzyme